MAMQMDSGRQRLIEQVLEYWYTVDFLAQGSLNMEETRRDREGWAHETEGRSFSFHLGETEGRSFSFHLDDGGTKRVVSNGSPAVPE